MLDKKMTYHFIGIGGIGMSGLARIMLARGYSVSGSDSVPSKITGDLKDLGAKIYIGHAAQNVKSADVVIYSAAISDTNPEIKEAKKKKLTLLRRSELLGKLMLEKKGIAVAGTHGKTTTSTMLGIVLSDAGLDPAMAIGGEVKNIGGNAKDGNGEYFVAEACEYDRSFLDLHPFAAIITNIEEDHLDCYKDLSDIAGIFKKFIGQIDKKGFLVISGDDEETVKAAQNYKGEVITYGINGKTTEYAARDIRVKDKKTVFSVLERGKSLGKFKLIVPGKHNVANALSVIAVARKIGIDKRKIKKSIAKFSGARRRFEIKGQKKGITVIDDYAHHPTEIQATLSGLSEYYPNCRIFCVFQPHQYSRTKFLFSDFAKSFSGVHKVIIPDIYEARDTARDKKAVSSEKLVHEVNKISHNAEYIGEFDPAAEYLKKNVKKGDVIITVGAGPVYKVGEEFLKSI